MQSKFKIDPKVYSRTMQCDWSRIRIVDDDHIAIYLPKGNYAGKDNVIKFAKSTMPKCRQIDLYVDSIPVKTFLMETDGKTWAEIDMNPHPILRSMILRRLRGKVWKRTDLGRNLFAKASELKLILQQLVDSGVVQQDSYQGPQGKPIILLRLSPKYFRN